MKDAGALRDRLGQLAGCEAPFLLGVRHHSPACAAAVGELLDRLDPDRLLVELPARYQAWLPWLGDPALKAPVALAGVARGSGALGFIPLADFSPELAAIRWAAARGVAVEAIDLDSGPVGSPAPEGRRRRRLGADPPDAGLPELEGAPADRREVALLARLLRRHEVADAGELWDRLVEARAVGAGAEGVRRAALLMGWVMRVDAALTRGVSQADLRRERFMRRRVAASLRRGQRPAAVVGAFHAAALLPEPLLYQDPAGPEERGPGPAPDAEETDRNKLPNNEGVEAPPQQDAEPRLTSREDPKGPRTSAAHAGSTQPKSDAAGVDGSPPQWGGYDERYPRDTSLIPYSFELLDARSGYPAGVRGPRWRQRVFEALGRGRGTHDLVAEAAVEVCRRVRAAGHPAGPPDATEVLRLATDLARLRRLPAPGRREVVEAVQAALGQGELLGRGRVLAGALEEVMVGRRRGELPPGAPRCGLEVHVERLLAELRLPGPAAASDPPRELRLDPLRGALDRRRHAALRRLCACGIPYAEPRRGEAAGRAEALTRRWTVRWRPATAALLAQAGARGVTLTQAAEGALVGHAAGLRRRGSFTADRQLALLEEAARCGLAGLVADGLRRLAVPGARDPARGPGLSGAFLQQAGLAELLGAQALVERLACGHIPALPLSEEDAPPGELQRAPTPDPALGAQLLAAAVRAANGLLGSEALGDARALGELVRRFGLRRAPAPTPGEGLDPASVESRARGQEILGGARLGWALDRLARDGSPLMQGAAGALRVAMGREAAGTFGRLLGSWLDAAREESMAALAGRLQGALAVSGPVFEGNPALLGALVARVERADEGLFLTRLPALRQGFEALSAAGRRRLLVALADRLERDPRPERALAVTLEQSPETLARLARADRAAARALAPWGGPPDAGTPRQDGALGAAPSSARDPGRQDGALGSAPSPARDPGRQDGALGAAPSEPGPRPLDPRDRWRLILGQPGPEMPPRARRAARALDELYGRGHGEGSLADLTSPGDDGAPFPAARRWSEELAALFGARVREQVLGLAAERGHPEALLELDPERVRPSVDLLQQVLALRGGLPEAHLVHLRRLVERVIRQLVRDLATRTRPALAGLSTPRPTRRRGGPLHLPRTVRANLRTARTLPDGTLQLAPQRLYFHTRARRCLPWQLVLLVDVSGSMERSVIHSALMAAILAGSPALRVQFVAFSTEIVDLTEHVADPLSLLLEISVGGRADLAKALRYGRQVSSVPARTLLLLVSDFEEDRSVDRLLGEVRAVVAAGIRPLGLAALDDSAAPRYCEAVASLVVDAGMPVAALTPLELARWVGEQVP